MLRPRARLGLRPSRFLAALALWALASGGVASAGTDLSLVPLWDGETQDLSGRLLNRFGGNDVGGIHARLAHTTAVVRSGGGAFRIDTNGVIAAGGFDFVGIALTGFGPSAAYVDTRDLTPFTDIVFWIRNETGSPFRLVLEIKDHRDSNLDRMRRGYTISATPEWREVRASLDLRSGWTIYGIPDLTRAKVLSLVVEASQGAPVSGRIYVDDMVLIERGLPLDAETAPLDKLVERLAYRQVRALWGMRDRKTGMLPAISSYADLCATNVLAALIQALPAAKERQWVSDLDTDNFVLNAMNTLQGVMDAADPPAHLPPRYLDRVTLAPAGAREESSVDAALLFLALYQYKSLPATPSHVRTAIDRFLARFDFAAFSSPAGWRLAYLIDEGRLTEQTYDGYSGEPWLISLAAHLSQAHHVDIATHWNTSVHRTRDFLVDPARAHLVHSSRDFRAPFLQWLFPLLVDVQARGLDTYPDPALAGNPFANAVAYQREAHAKAALLGRATRLQPDAGDDGSGGNYEQFSYYQDFGLPELYMPWSAAFGLLAEPQVAGAALRDHLTNRLHGPLGLSDAIRWETGAPAPALVTARHDLWNVGLSTMALLSYLEGGKTPLSELPEVRAALDKVFSPAVCVPGPTALCLSHGRFEVSAAWRTGQGTTGTGQGVALTDETGYFWFFAPTNLEAIVKVLDACALTGRFWVFGAGLTDVEVDLTVRDSVSGTERTYRNPQGRPFAPLQDTNAFACP